MSSHHLTHASQAIARLSEWGFPSAILERIGAFGVLWTAFESRLETVVWMLKGEVVRDRIPSTDKTSLSDWIKAFSKGADWLPADANKVLAIAAQAATDLADYRHALVHGWVMPYKSAPFFVRNPSWNGERRRRPSNDAHIDENLLNMAISAVATLNDIAAILRYSPRDSERLIALTQPALQAKSMASELRHLSEVVNSEKY